MKKRILFLGLLAIILIYLVSWYFESNNNIITSNYEIKTEDNLAVMIYDDVVGEYKASDDIPVGDFELNIGMTYCENGGSINGYNSLEGIVTYSFSSGGKCYLYFDAGSLPNLSDTILSLADGSDRESSQATGSIYVIKNEIVSESTDITLDAGIRYKGKDPNNYVLFNGNELWRIIGIFEGSTIGLSSGNYYTKIIRNSTIGNTAWSTSSSSSLWDGADLKSYLNSTYYNEMNLTLKNMSVKAAWYIGHFYYSTSVTNAYINEKKQIYNDHVGLFSPSDYGFSCYSSTAYTLDTYSSCSGNNWLFDGSRQLTISSHAVSSSDSSIGTSVNCVESDGDLYYISKSSETYAARPVVYLHFAVKIKTGDGSLNNPYILV